MHRLELASIVLQLKALDTDDMMSFDWLVSIIVTRCDPFQTLAGP